MDLEGKADLYQSLLKREDEKAEPDHRYRASLKIELAETFERLGQYDKATVYARDGRGLAETYGDRRLVARALHILGITSRDPSLIAAAMETPHLPWRDKAEMGLGLGKLQVKLGLIDAARSSYHAAADLYRVEAETAGMANALAASADLERIYGDRHSAEATYREVLRVLATTPGVPAKPRALIGLADIEWRRGNGTGASQYYNEALAECRKQGEDGQLCDALNGLGTLDLRTGHLDEARNIFRELADISRKNGLLRSEANSYLGLGNVAAASGDFAAAREHFAQAKNQYESVSDRLGVGNSWRFIGLLDVKTGDFARARDRYAKAIAIYRSLGETVGLGLTLAELAIAEHMLDDTQAADEHLEEAADAARISDFPDAERYVEQARAQIHPPPDTQK